MPWQRSLLNVALEANPDGTLAHRVVVVTVPRQSGKSVLLRGVAMFYLLRAPLQQVWATAQTREDAKDRWSDCAKALQHSPLVGEVSAVRRGSGSEQMDMVNGSHYRIFSPVEAGAHGASIDLGIIDEAWAVPDRVIQGLQPTQAARDDPQLWIVSTAGDAGSSMFNRYTDLGRSEIGDGSTGPGLVFCEYSADRDLDPEDPDTWRGCMPALGETITIDKIELAHSLLPAAEFQRAYLNWPQVHHAPLLTAHRWDAVQDPHSVPGRDLALGIEMAVDRSAASIVAASTRADGLIDVELIEQRDGISWVAQRVIDLIHKHSPTAWVLDERGPAVTVSEQLTLAGYAPRITTTREFCSASAGFFDAVMDDPPIVAVRPHSTLNAAALAAQKRKIGDGWAWGRTKTDVDISPLVAASLAVWGAVNISAPGVH